MQVTSSLAQRILLTLGLVLATGTAWGTTPLALVTVMNGESVLLRGANKLALAEGVKLEADDIVELGPQAQLLRVEFSDGCSLLLGPGSRALLAPRLSGERGKARAYLLSGWAKVSAPADVDFTLLSPLIDLRGKGSHAVLAITDNSTHAQLFSEAGNWQLHLTDAETFPLKGGDFVSFVLGSKPEMTSHLSPVFLQAMPRAFRDTLPARAGLFQDKVVVAKMLAPISYDDAQAWLTAEPALRRAELPRWQPLARETAFRAGLVKGLAHHPEWKPILFPPVENNSQSQH